MAESVGLREFLKGVECFAALEPASLALLEDKMTLASYQPGEVICEEGEPGEWMFIVAEGELAVRKKAEDSVIQVAVLKPGDFGGMMSLFDEEPRSATLMARGPVTLWRLDHDTFHELLLENNALSLKMLTFLSQRMRRDSHNLAATLRYTHVSGLDKVYVECSPQERLILDTVNHKVAAADSLDAVMNFYFDSIRKVGPCDRIGLAFVQEDGTRLVSHWNRATYEPLHLEKDYAYGLLDSSLESVLESGAPRIIDDLEEYLHQHPNSRATKLVVEEGLRSNIACPLVVGDRPIGILFRSSRRPKAYDEHQVRIHYAVADRLSQAVEKAYRIEQLTAANKGYFEMLGFVSHELKSPISSVVMNGNVMLGGYMGELGDKQRDALERMMKQCHYLLGLVNDYLNLAHMESGQLDVQIKRDVDFVAAVVEPALDTVEPQLQDKKIRLERSAPAQAVYADCAPEMLQIVMVNLLSNAVKYGVEGGDVRLAVERQNGMLRVSVWNSGPGFPEDQRLRLFRKFSRLQTDELLKRRGTGVGLYTTWRIVQAHHGHIEANSKHGKWAEFAFELPQPSPCRGTGEDATA